MTATTTLRVKDIINNLFDEDFKFERSFDIYEEQNEIVIKYILDKDNIEGEFETSYDISIRTIRSEKDILNWVTHISSKRWCTPKIISSFIYHATSYLEKK